MNDAIVKLKAEIYDLVMQSQRLQAAIQQREQKIAQLTKAAEQESDD